MQKLFIYLFFILLFGCTDKSEGLIGSNNSKTKSINDNSFVCNYIPTVDSFKLINGSVLKIDTGWGEKKFYIKNRKKVFDTTLGYTLVIPYTVNNSNPFVFDFVIADKSNQMFTHPVDNDFIGLKPKMLNDEILVFLEQKNPDTSIGWRKPIITDTFLLKRVK